MQIPEISLVVPCFNESASLPELLERCGRLTRDAAVEVILVDNGSTDDSAEVLARLLPLYPGCRSVSVSVNQGYGHGILAGLVVANAPWIGWTHADLQADVLDVLKALPLVRAHPAGAFIKGRRVGRPLGDRIFTWGMSIYETLLMRQRLWDINAQPTLFHRDFYRTWDAPPEDFSLDLYAYHQACRQGLKVVRFEVRFLARKFGQSHWNVNWSAKRQFIRRTVAFSLALRRREIHADHQS